MQDDHKKLFEPCGNGLISHSKKDFKVEENSDCLTIKAPHSKVPGFIIVSVITLIGLIFIMHLMGRSILPGILPLFYCLGVPMYFVVIFIIYFCVHDFHKGDWLIWDKRTGEIIFPRLGKTKKIDDLVCFQQICDPYFSESHYELNCVFKTGGGFERCPLFLYYTSFDSYLTHLAQRFGTQFQMVHFNKKQPVISGYDFLRDESSSQCSKGVSG